MDLDDLINELNNIKVDNNNNINSESYSKWINKIILLIIKHIENNKEDFTIFNESEIDKARKILKLKKANVKNLKFHNEKYIIETTKDTRVIYSKIYKRLFYKDGLYSLMIVCNKNTYKKIITLFTIAYIANYQLFNSQGCYRSELAIKRLNQFFNNKLDNLDYMYSYRDKEYFDFFDYIFKDVYKLDIELLECLKVNLL